MKVTLAYGKQGLPVQLPDRNVTVIEPRQIPGLADEAAALQAAMRAPIGAPPLRDLVSPGDRVVIVFSDLTRPMPSDRVLPVLLQELAHVPREQITLLGALGTHRPNTPEELDRMLTPEVARNYRIIQHNCMDLEQMVYLGKTSSGHDIHLNRAYMEADVKILTGFVEPHLFAGFSGGPKAVLPGVASAQLILANHGAEMLNHPRATWGITEGNPVHAEMREVALLTHPTFLLNVTLNKRREITGVFAGDLLQAHQKATAFARELSMVPVPEPFDIVISSNSGYPLDLNLYQAVKGMSASRQIVKPGGSIIVAAECWDGVPDHGNYKWILHQASNPQELLEFVNRPGFCMTDQWEGHIQALIQLHADVYVKNSYLSDEELRKALFLPCHSIEETLAELMVKHGPEATICVLPEGPQTIPYIAGTRS